MASNILGTTFEPRNPGERFEIVMQADENGQLWHKRYAKDAWQRPKVIHDYSIFSATWTQSVPARVWEEEHVQRVGNTVVVTPISGFTNVSSRQGMLSVKSGNVALEGNAVKSKTFPRYQPNRGQIYSTAVTCPEPTLNGYRQWGLATAVNGVYFRLVGDGSNWDLFVGRRRQGVELELISIKDKLPSSFDPSKGHVFDIQYEWRGVGNFYFFVDLDLVYSLDVLGTLDYLSVDDPALGVVYSTYSYENGVELELLSGCVDVSSEGGVPEKTLFGSISTGDTLVNLGNTALIDVAVLALRVPRMVNYNGGSIFNSRSAIMDKLVSWTRDEALTKAYVFRDTSASNLDSLNWLSLPDSSLEYAVGGGTSDLHTAFVADATNGNVVITEWADLEVKNIITNPATNSDFLLTPGDMLVIAVNCIGANKNSATTLYYSEQL